MIIAVAGTGSCGFVLATLELGRIAERLGEQQKAANCCGLVVATGRRPGRELVPYVAEAREGPRAAQCGVKPRKRSLTEQRPMEQSISPARADAPAAAAYTAKAKRAQES